MKRTLSDNDRKRLEKLIADVEKDTNAQIVLALIHRSDNYAEIPWKAFALGASAAGFAVFILDLLFYSWYTGFSLLMAVAGILASGAVLAFLTVLIPAFAQRFLSPPRAETEVQQYAESLFLSRELFATSKRTGILVLVSMFERKVVILPDTGLKDKLSEEALKTIIAQMAPLLKKREIFQAFEAGLNMFSHILGIRIEGAEENELSDDIIEEKGV